MSSQPTSDVSGPRIAGPFGRLVGAVVAAAFGAWFLLWAATQVDRPLAQDQSIFVWVSTVLRQGGMPYRDAFEIKGPGLLYSVAAAEWLTGGALWGLRAADVAMTAVGCLLIWRLLRPLGAAIAAVGVGTYFAWYSALGFMDAAQPDGWAGIAILGMVVSAVRDRDGAFASAAVRGALLSVATLFKPVYAVLGLILLGDLAWRLVGQRRRAASVFFGNLVGGLLPLTLILGWFGAHGVIPQWLEANVYYTASVYAPGSFFFKVSLLVKSLLGSPSMVVALALSLSGVISTWRQSKPHLAALLVAWIVGALAVVALQAKYWPYHWLPTTSALAVAAAIGAGGVAAKVKGWAASRFKRSLPVDTMTLAAVAAGLIVPSAVRSWRTSAEWIGAVASPEARNRYEDQFGYYGRGRLSYYRIAASLKGLGRPDEPIVVWGNQAVLYVLSDRPSATRFGWNWSLVRYPGNEFGERFKAEYVAAVQKAKPVAIIARTPDDCRPPLARDAQLECLDQFPALAAFTQANYSIIATHGRYAVYARRDLALVGAPIRVIP